MRASNDAGIFTAAHALAPSVIFIDELDALAPARGGGDSEGGGGGGTAPEPAAEMCGRIVSSLLTAMDGINTHPASAGEPFVPPTAHRHVSLMEMQQTSRQQWGQTYMHILMYLCAYTSIHGCCIWCIHCANFDSTSAVILCSAGWLRQTRHDSATRLFDDRCHCSSFSLCSSSSANSILSICSGADM